MKIEIELTEEQAANFRIEFEGFECRRQMLADVLRMIDQAIVRQTIMLGDIVTHATQDSTDFIVRGLHASIAWLWLPDDAGKWVPWGDAKLIELTKKQK